MPSSRRARWLGVYLGLMLLINAVLIWKTRDGIRSGYGDFASFYTAGRMLAHGHGLQLYDRDLQFRVQQEFAPHIANWHAPLPYIHPPFEALLFVPLAQLPYLAAYFGWTILSLAILFALPWILRPYVPWLRQRSTAIWFLAVLAYFPVVVALLQGQDVVLLLLIFVLVYQALRRKAEFAAGCWLGFGLFRPQFVLPVVLVLMLRRRWKLLGGFSATAATLGLVSLAMVGWDELLHYPQFVWLLEHSPAGGTVAEQMPNLHGLLATLGPELKLPGGWMSSAIALGSALLLALAARWWHTRTAASFDFAFSLTLVAAVLVSYHALEHDLTLLLLPMALIANYVTERKRLAVGLVVPILILFFTPLHVWLSLQEQRASLLALVLLAWMAAIAGELKWEGANAFGTSPRSP